MAFVGCVVLAIATTWYWRPDLDWRNLRVVLAIVFATAIVTYHQFWKLSGIAPAIEEKTG